MGPPCRNPKNSVYTEQRCHHLERHRSRALQRTAPCEATRAAEAELRAASHARRVVTPSDADCCAIHTTDGRQLGRDDRNGRACALHAAGRVSASAVAKLMAASV